MHKLALTILFVVTLPLFASRADETEIRAVVEKYFLAHSTGQGAPLLEAFHPDWKMLWVKDGALMTRTRDEYASGFKGTAPADEAKRKRSIEMIDVTGNAAVAKVRLDYPATTFVDYMLLLKVDGRWQVVTKAFNATPKTPPAN
jgi:hypothetical protein